MNLEQELRAALKRKDPEGGFSERVLLKVASGATTPIPNRRRARAARLSWAIAASVIFAAGSTYYVQNQRRAHDEQAARAARDVVLALSIASQTISAAQAKVEEITRYDRSNDY